MSENVKIVINEYDLTKPVSEYTSSDIVFMPGFLNVASPDTVSNIPKLYISVSEFLKDNTVEGVAGPYTITNGDAVALRSIGLATSSASASIEDPSFYYAKTLLENGISVVYMPLNGIETTDDLNENVSLLKDRNEYNVKYLTSGGYASCYKESDGQGGNVLTYNFAETILKIATSRGDCVALIDYEYTTSVAIYAESAVPSIYKDLSTLVSSIDDDNCNPSYSAAFQPWAKYKLKENTPTDVLMPPSFGYCLAMAKAIKTNPNWLAVAGVSRGIVPKITSLDCKNNMLNNMLAEEMQPKVGDTDHQISINCITDIKPYGLTIWGNRTLRPLEVKKSTTATNFLNTRNMISDIKKVLYSSAKSLMFEQNSDDLWLRFKALVTPLLNQLKSSSAISDFKIIKLNTKYDGQPLVKGEIAATIRVYPMYAVEYFELNVELSDQDVTVNG